MVHTRPGMFIERKQNIIYHDREQTTKPGISSMKCKTSKYAYVGETGQKMRYYMLVHGVLVTCGEVATLRKFCLY
jgi:hypothetical protein